MQDNELKSAAQASEAAPQEGAQTEAQEVPELSVENLSEELAKAQAKAAENYDLFLRAKAESDNVRRRAAEDVAKARKFSIEKFAESMLPVVDSLEKALEASQGETSHLKEGLEITYRQLLSGLEHNGMKPEDPVGQKFDPNSMQAISMVQDPAVESGCVAKVFQKGWKIADRVLRPAMVAVAQ